jgi:hypothetical protein
MEMAEIHQEAIKSENCIEELKCELNNQGKNMQTIPAGSPF